MPDLTIPTQLANAQARARRIWILDNNELVPKWIGTLRGIAITAPDGTYHFDTETAARAAAREFRNHCRSAIAQP